MREALESGHEQTDSLSEREEITHGFLLDTVGLWGSGRVG